MTKISIREAGIKDIADLQKISQQTFYETFREANTAENMAKYLDESLSIEKLTTELHDPHSVFYFALSKKMQNTFG